MRPTFANSTVSIFKSLRIVWVLLWMLLTTCIFIKGIDLGYDARVYAFDNWCPAEVRHSMDQRDLNEERIDWCDTSWWHPYRLATRVLPGFMAAALMVFFARLLLSNSMNLSKRRVFFVSSVAALWVSYFSLMPPYKAPVKYFCLWSYHEAVSPAQCAKYLGTFGDQRLYYAGSVVIFFVLLSLIVNTKGNSGDAPLDVDDLER